MVSVLHWLFWLHWLVVSVLHWLVLHWFVGFCLGFGLHWLVLVALVALVGGLCLPLVGSFIGWLCIDSDRVPCRLDYVASGVSHVE